MSKYQPGDHRRNDTWKRESRRERRLCELATQRRWTVAEWAWRCEKVRNLVATGMSRREARKAVDA